MKKDGLDTIVNDIQSKIEAEEEKTFSAKVIGEFKNPSNIGRIEDADCIGVITGPCGDTMEFTINISNGKIQRILFMTDGCGPSIACGSMTTKLAVGKTVEEALEIRYKDILNALDGLPEENRHCTKLTADTLHEALGKFLEDKPQSDRDTIMDINRGGGRLDNKGDRRISNRVLQIQGSAIHEMTRLSRGIEDVAFLSWAKPTSGTPEHINSAAIKAIEDGKVGGYSSSAGIPKLRRSISEKLRSVNHIDSSEDEIVVTVGAIEGLAASVMAVIDPGDEVIFPIPTYSTHIRQVQLASGKPVFVPTDEDNGFDLDLGSIEKAITPGTKAIMYCSPNNPTGAVYTEKQLRGLADIALENDLFVITDEAYEYFTYDGHEHFSIASIPEMKERTLSSFTFTKTYAMTGWRIGYLHADASLIPQINKAHIPLAICAPVVSQYAALAALEGPQDCVDEFRENYRSSRDLMCKRLDELDQVFEYQKPKGSYLMFPRIITDDAGDSTKFCKALLRDAKVSTTPGVAFGPNGEGHARMSFCVPEAEIDKAFDRMDQYLN